MRERVCVTLLSSSPQVSAELQQEVLMSLIQTDPDIIDYLLRRKLRLVSTSGPIFTNSLGVGPYILIYYDLKG